MKLFRNVKYLLTLTYFVLKKLHNNNKHCKRGHHLISNILCTPLPDHSTVSSIDVRYISDYEHAALANSNLDVDKRLLWYSVSITFHKLVREKLR